MHKFDFKADLRSVYSRLAGQFKATVAQAEEQPIRTRQVGVSITSGSSNFEGKDNSMW